MLANTFHGSGASINNVSLSLPDSLEITDNAPYVPFAVTLRGGAIPTNTCEYCERIASSHAVEGSVKSTS